MGLWFSNPDLKPGESIHWSGAANRSVGRAVGGKLFVTDQRSVFLPNKVDRAFRAADWEIPLSQIAKVGVESLTHAVVAGPLRRRLFVLDRAGRVEAFIVNNTREAGAQILAAVYEFAA